MDGRAYYNALKLLKSLGLKYFDMNPKEEVEGVKVILTTKAEGWGDKRLMFIDEFEFEDAKLELPKRILGEGGELVMGVDPGERTGFVALYRNVPIDRGIFTSVGELVDRISRLSKHFKDSKKVRIGLDTEGLALKIARTLKGLGLRIELVDERGTTRKAGSSRDIESARAIAMRHGIEFEGV